ncbi:MAG: hypothetical protein AB1341_08230 [Bacillota bacterium]|uniref:Uncharacterized protein n=1 Tax=Desulforamulus putei DSM 12395 TaxID=1121429 RepID=A0A1M5CN21_9FIRM|nr:hypothetical protein SAMN02745133_02979 [Desulforamulus putei DSM 12395]
MSRKDNEIDKFLRKILNMRVEITVDKKVDDDPTYFYNQAVLLENRCDTEENSYHL